MEKANMSLTRNAMPVQDAHVRAHNFDEVALGYTEEQAIDEANRCLNCKNMPCVDGCPVKIHIPEFISKIKEGDFEGAYQIITKSSSLPAVCGRVCPQETQCESKCVRGIKGESVGIGRLERFVADWHNTFCTEEPVRPESNGHRVAIVGSGPSGLTCAGDLAKRGYDVTVYEALHTAGGVLVYGIPEFRLPKKIVAKEVDTLKKLVNGQGLTDHHVGFNMNAKLLERINFLCYDLLGKTELGNTVHKHAASGVKRLINGYVIAKLCKISCACKSGRTGTNDGNSVSVACRFYGFFLTEGIVPVGNETLKATDSNRLSLDTSDTLGFTLRFLRTNSTANSRK